MAGPGWVEAKRLIKFHTLFYNMNSLLDRFPFFKKSSSQKFHERTKLLSFRNVSKSSVSKWPSEWTDINYKGYTRFKKVKLPKPKVDTIKSLTEILSLRHSSHEFHNQSLSLIQLSNLLYYSLGIKDESTGRRFYPSAGARYPIEAYVVVFNIKNLRPGLYHYHLKSHSLEFMWSFKNMKNQVMKSFSVEWLKKASTILILTGLFWRNEVKYGDRGYRHVLAESGIITQNISLVATMLNLKTNAVGGYIDDVLNNLLDVDGEEESVLGVIGIGE